MIDRKRQTASTDVPDDPARRRLLGGMALAGAALAVGDSGHASVRTVDAAATAATETRGAPGSGSGQAPPAAAVTANTPDIRGHFEFPASMFDYTAREAMITMRDGAKLYTVILLLKGAAHAPMVLTRTPYNAHDIALGNPQRRLRDSLPLSDDIFVDAGYIRVYQDVRGKYRSEGEYFMAPPLVGTINSAKVDDSTDAWDTIDWLVRHVPESNGRVGMIGYSYPGFTTAMALFNPHPALRAAAPENPQIDGWMGDDWFHYGAFRNVNLSYFTEQTATKGMGPDIPNPAYDDYTTFLEAGSSGDYARAAGLDQLPWWEKIIQHPAYDDFWSRQAVDRNLAGQPLKVPTLWVQGLWDHVDMYGAAHGYAALEPKDRGNDMNFLVMGPWRHGQQNFTGRSLGPFHWKGDTSLQFRHDILAPFFASHLVAGAPKAKLSPVTAYNAGTNEWEHFDRWPLACDEGCAVKPTPVYLRAGGNLDFTGPAADDDRFTSYVSDPMRPVPILPRPIHHWGDWSVGDQRFVDDRPDVVSFTSRPLAEPIQVSGRPIVHVYASTSGTDSDWVVKIIDVFPYLYPEDPPLGGYEFPLSMAIFRGRYRTSFVHPAPIAPNEPLLYTFALPNINYRFRPGHRMLVQIQSSWFPLYDRNPQTYVDNIFFAKRGDYRKAEQRIWHASPHASSVRMPIVPVRRS